MLKADVRKKKSRTSHRKPAKAPGGLQFSDLSHRSLGGNNDGVQNETVLVTLNLADHLRLVFRRAVMVDNTQAAEQSHVNGHVVLRHGVHGRR